MEKLSISKTVLKMAEGEDAYPSSYSPGSAPRHQIQKPSKESSIFNSLAPLVLFFFTKR